MMKNNYLDDYPEDYEFEDYNDDTIEDEVLETIESLDYSQLDFIQNFVQKYVGSEEWQTSSQLF